MAVVVPLIDAKYLTVLPPGNLPYRVHLLGQNLARKFQNMLKPHGLTPFHWGVLCCLWQEDGQPTLVLAAELRQLPSTLTGVLKTMERRGLVRRELDAEDRRVWRVWLTDAGAALQPVLLPKAERLLRDVLSPLASTELNVFSGMVDRLTRNLGR